MSVSLPGKRSPLKLDIFSHIKLPTRKWVTLQIENKAVNQRFPIVPIKHSSAEIDFGVHHGICCCSRCPVTFVVVGMNVKQDNVSKLAG